MASSRARTPPRSRWLSAEMDTNEQQSASGSSASEPHSTRPGVWGVPSAIDSGATFRFKVGVSCAHGCRAEDWLVEIRDGDGRSLANASLGDTPWPGTAALYYAELEIRAPTADGLYEWEAYVARATAPSHPASSVRFYVRVVPTAQCRLKVVAVDAQSQMPVQDARVVAHPYRASTGEDGVAELRVPKGEYRVFVSGRRYLPFRSDGEIDTDTTIRAELDADVGPTDAELWA
jgi:hypothetical protein